MPLQEIEFLGGTAILVVGMDPATGKMYALPVDPATGQVITGPGSGSGVGTHVDGNTAAGGADSGNPVKTGGKYNAVAPVLVDGYRGDTQLDAAANTKVTLATLIEGENQTSHVLGTIHKPVNDATYSPSRHADAGSVTKAVVKASAGSVLSIRVSNANAAIRYFQLHNKATAPSAGETAQTGMSFLLPAGTATVPSIVQIDVSYFASLEYFSTGIGWAISTTDTTFTDSATAADHRVKISYV